MVNSYDSRAIGLTILIGRVGSQNVTRIFDHYEDGNRLYMVCPVKLTSKSKSIDHHVKSKIHKNYKDSC